MADPVLDAISVLNRIDEENKVWEAQNKARLQVRLVLEQYVIAKRTLDELETHKATVEESISRLQSRYDAASDEIQDQLRTKRAEAESEIANLTEQLTNLQTAANTLQSEHEEKKTLLETSISELRVQVSGLKDEKSVLIEDITTLKAKHGLGG